MEETLKRVTKIEDSFTATCQAKKVLYQADFTEVLCGIAHTVIEIVEIRRIEVLAWLENVVVWWAWKSTL